MKLIVNERDGCCKSISIEYTPTEARIINHAMRRYVKDEEVDEKGRIIMEQMLDVNPIFVDVTDKEKQIQDYERKMLIEELSKMPSMVITTAYLHALNYTLYGEDVTEKWLTATQNASALEKAYRKGYYDALQRQVESEDNE